MRTCEDGRQGRGGEGRVWALPGWHAPLGPTYPPAAGGALRRLRQLTFWYLWPPWRSCISPSGNLTWHCTSHLPSELCGDGPARGVWRLRLWCRHCMHTTPERQGALPSCKPTPGTPAPCQSIWLAAAARLCGAAWRRAAAVAATAAGEAAVTARWRRWPGRLPWREKGLGGLSEVCWGLIETRGVKRCPRASPNLQGCARVNRARKGGKKCQRACPRQYTLYFRRELGACKELILLFQQHLQLEAASRRPRSAWGTTVSSLARCAPAPSHPR